MILVTVGMHTDGFPRLVEAMDRVAAQVDEEVVMQIGSSPCQPQAARWFTFAPQEQMDELCAQARVIVSHAGAGSILTALRYRKPLVVLPRLRKYKEHVDDHQIELATILSQRETLLVAAEAAELKEILTRVHDFAPPTPDRGLLVQAIRQAVLNGVDRSG